MDGAFQDFVWGLLRNGHEVYVLSSNAPYLAPASNIGPNNEFVNRELILKGSFERVVILKPTRHLFRPLINIIPLY